MNYAPNYPLIPPPGALPEAENVTEEAPFCHLPETAVTSIKIRENNALDGVCHRSINTHSDVVTSEKNEDRGNHPQTGGTVSAYEASVTEAEWRRDCLKLAATKLKERYPGTYQAYHAMRYVRSKPIAEGGEGAIINENMRSLAKFMRALGGPRRHIDMTVERLHHLDPEYAADKIVWADKTQQARNRETNSLVRNPLTGKDGPVAEVAEQVGLKPNTLTQALNRAIKKTPEKEAEIRLTIVGKYLDKRPSCAASAAPVATEEVAPPSALPVRRAPVDFRMRWPVDMPKDKRDQWEQKFKEGRKVVNEETGELEWRYEFYIRTIRQWLIAAGFGGRLIGQSPSPYGTTLEKMRREWADEEDPTDAELSAYAAQEDIYTRCVARLQEAMAALPEFEAEARQRRRERDRTYPRYGRFRPSRDYEDEAMKDAEWNGTDADTEAVTEAAPNADDWQREYAADKPRERIERRRGIDL